MVVGAVLLYLSSLYMILLVAQNSLSLEQMTDLVIVFIVINLLLSAGIAVHLIRQEKNKKEADKLAAEKEEEDISLSDPQ